MIHDNAVVGAPLTLYKDTKANIEAIGSPVEGMQAFATDEDRPMFYGSAWKIGLLSDFDNDGLYWDSANGQLGIGISTTADGKLHLYEGSAGTVTAPTFSNNLVIESSNAAGISFLSTDTNACQIFFGSPSDNDRAAIAVYNISHSTAADEMRFRTAGATKLSLNGSGSLLIGTFTDGMTSGGSLAISQDLAHRGTKAGFYNTTPITKPTVSGARDDSEDALANLLTALANLGLITNSTSAS